MSDYSSNFPTQSPTFAFDAKAGKLDSRISYSRSSTGTYMSNERHLSSENLITQSQFSGWAELYSPTVTAAYTNGPDGSSNTATRLQSASGADRYVYSTETSWTSGQQYTVSCWVKSNTGVAQTFQFFLPTTAYASADLTTHATDWTRITATFTAATSSQYCGFKLLSANTTDLSIWGFQVNSGANALDYQATSGQIHREFAPTLKTASADEPRFEYAADGQSDAGSPLGLLIEAQAVNLQRYGSEFASWSDISNSTVTANSGIAPNGLLEADLAVATSASNYHYVFDAGATVANATTYTGSCYIKQAGHRYIQITGASANFGSAQYATFDLDDGSIDVNGGVTASAVGVGNGWYRITATMTSTSSGGGGMALTFANSATSVRLPTFSGNNFDGVLCWGFQFETGSSASSLVDTGSQNSTLTRASDSCAVVDATLFSSGEHTIIWEGDTDYSPTDKRFFALSDGSFNNRFVADYDNGTTTRLRNWADDVSNVGISTSTVDMLVGSHKLAATLKTNECQLVIDGTRRQVDTSCVVGGGIDQLAINSSTTGAGPTYNMNGHCKRITYYNVALSQTEAEALTSNP